MQTGRPTLRPTGREHGPIGLISCVSFSLGFFSPFRLYSPSGKKERNGKLDRSLTLSIMAGIPEDGNGTPLTTFLGESNTDDGSEDGCIEQVGSFVFQDEECGPSRRAHRRAGGQGWQGRMFYVCMYSGYCSECSALLIVGSGTTLDAPVGLCPGYVYCVWGRITGRSSRQA